MTEIEKYIKENQNKLIDGFVLPMVTCQDGFRISIQCGWGHYSSPKVSRRGALPDSPSHFELGFPSKYEELLSNFAQDITYNKNNLDTVFSFVPVETVNGIINKHGGIKEVV